MDTRKPKARSTQPEAIAAAVLNVFLRYGFRKTSMDDLARAAGLSRQGLYLYFATKEQLFEAALEHLITRTLDAARRIADQRDLDVEEQLLRVFQELQGETLDLSSREHRNELIEVARQTSGSRVANLERGFVELLAGILVRAGVAASWKDTGVTALQLAEHLFDAANGIKSSVTSREAYLVRLRTSIQIITRGASRRDAKEPGS
ncbi:Transcriptional regulator, TetR family [Cystobacter fuscus DSM 2262]|uniref:Transcriptional regulator, TetR family n=1 Tax=Cystobacter fuscus (strain ATCC 25194 / DSM 2262 / NBRC 100088 / M29) TaxID=1242864 RepID=S9PER2_CYSF2|nr:TetR/AcrR family transcriptional regulator [Cystobacter fuscus]EPX61526.1 Transcriptional regulator, TetR family [Cystobacter fuscus DSM 2262]